MVITRQSAALRLLFGCGLLRRAAARGVLWSAVTVPS